MSKPKRIQLRRTKGWRKSEGAIVVARPSRWGNPYRIGDDIMYPHPGTVPYEFAHSHTFPPGEYSWFDVRAIDRAEAVRLFRSYIENEYGPDLDVLGPLAGHDLACWCPLDQPCHADVLLELANPRTQPPNDGGM